MTLASNEDVEKGPDEFEGRLKGSLDLSATDDRSIQHVLTGRFSSISIKFFRWGFFYSFNVHGDPRALLLRASESTVRLAVRAAR